MAFKETGKANIKQFDKDMDEALDLLDDLTEEELAALEKDFDPDDAYAPAQERKREEDKSRLFQKKDMVEHLENVFRKNKDISKPTERIKPVKSWKNSTLESSNIIYNKQTNDSNNNTNKTYRQYEKKKEENITGLTEEEEALFDDLSEEDLLELAALSGTHGVLTQDQVFAHERGESPENIRRLGQHIRAEPVKSPMRRLMSMSDDNTDLDGILLADSLKEDIDDVFYIRINNVPLESTLLHTIFDSLKTTKVIKHLSLAGVGIKDEDGLLFNEAFAENETLETLNLESNELTNETIEPLLKIMETHKTIREFKCAHQKHGLGSRGEEAMAKALNKNEQLLKISYPFKVQSARSLADRCQIRNNEMLRRKRTQGEDFYNYKEEIKKRDAHPQPWIKEQEDKNEKMKSDLADQKGKMKSVPNVRKTIAESKLRAKENAKPTMDNELASKLAAARKSRGRSIR